MIIHYVSEMCVYMCVTLGTELYKVVNCVLGSLHDRRSANEDKVKGGVQNVPKADISFAGVTDQIEVLLNRRITPYDAE